MKQNRRVIYLSDEEWAKAKSRAGKGTVSGVFREALRQLRTPSGYLTVQEVKARVQADAQAVAATFVPEFNPVPKPGAKKR